MTRPSVDSRLVRLIPIALLAGLVLAACASTAGPGWTYEPPPPATPTPAASAAPSGSASEAPSAGASAAPSAAPSGATGGTVLNVKASSIAFDVTSLTAPAGQPFQIAFDNEDAGVPHNIAITDSAGAVAWKGDLVTGVTQTTYNVPALSAGTYTFMCQVHPTMTGTLEVK